MRDWYTLDSRGNPVKSDIGSGFTLSPEERTVAASKFDDATLSTVFLQLDHSFGSVNPILYESLWFGGPFDGEMRRYCTKEEAIQGHNDMLLDYAEKTGKKVLLEKLKSARRTILDDWNAAW